MASPTPIRPSGNLAVRFAYVLIDTIGRLTSLLVFVLIGILLYGVVMRYALGAPSVWVSELSGMLYACYFLVGGAYAIIHNDHVNVDVFRSRLPVRAKAALDLVTWVLFYVMVGVIFWLGIGYAHDSVAKLERSSTVWGPYVWPVKLIVPISAFMMLVAGALKTTADIKAIVRSRQ